MRPKVVITVLLLALFFLGLMAVGFAVLPPPSSSFDLLRSSFLNPVWRLRPGMAAVRAKGARFRKSGSLCHQSAN